MDKYQALEILKTMFFNAIADEAISSHEINKIQDWIDEYAVLFCGDDYQKIILPLQKFVDDGEFTLNEIKTTYNLLSSCANK